ncbi:hypothetical protein QCA50_004317 [Cerrena zonata]|uniref:Uncharacterized protein n=1 Tax=Cerrena zonata TaxID=2478898 RepID=A0AAW0GLJ8_9APHY
MARVVCVDQQVWILRQRTAFSGPLFLIDISVTVPPASVPLISLRWIPMWTPSEQIVYHPRGHRTAAVSCDVSSRLSEEGRHSHSGALSINMSRTSNMTSCIRRVRVMNY